MHMLKEHPLTGVGIGNFRPNALAGSPDYKGARTPHSNWVEAGSELGIPGLVLYVWLLYLAFKRNRETRTRADILGHEGRYVKAFSHALDISMVGFVVAGTFTAILYYPFVFMNLALIISLREIVTHLRPTNNISIESASRTHHLHASGGRLAT
jgi:O-antigen ligase